MKIIVLLLLTVLWIPFGLMSFPPYAIRLKMKKTDISTDVMKMFIFWLLFPIMHKIVYAARCP